MTIFRISQILVYYRYELIAGSVGAIVMMTEIIGARFIAPYLGTSFFVWTAVIGVILGALSAGYWYGGRLADKGANDQMLGRLILGSASLLLVALIAQEAVLSTLAASGWDIRISSLMAALILFAPATVLLGMESPYVVKLRLKELATAGQSVGRLYAAGTIGSIIGTFAAGYFLIGILGSTLLGFLLVTALVGVSIVASTRDKLRLKLTLAGATMILMGLPIGPTSYQVIYDTDSAYSRYQVIEERGPQRTLRILKMGNAGAQSGVFLDDPSEIVFDYTKRFMEAAATSPPGSVLMIGGGAFTVPRALAETYPKARIDVVEIDPKLTELSERFFFYTSSEQINIINQDGRVFLNRNDTRYDMVFIDAFSSLTPPFQLTTQEAVRRLAQSVNDDGVVVVNLVTAYQGGGSAFLQSEYRTYATEFPFLALVQARPGLPYDAQQNLIMIAGKRAEPVAAVVGGLKGSPLPEPARDEAIILTDDYAPVEQLLQQR